MNVFGIFKSVSPPGEGDNPNSNDDNRNTMERSSQSQQRESSVDGKTYWYDWVDPKWKERQLKDKVDNALDELERIANGLGRN